MPNNGGRNPFGENAVIISFREIFVQWYHSIMILNDISEPRTGCVGEFATFGFLTFLISLLNTLLNIGKITMR